MPKDIYEVEYTDTFGGEANYCWVKRTTIEVAPIEPDTIYTSGKTVAMKRHAHDLEVIRKAKAAVGLTGVRGRACWIGDTYEFRPYRMATVMFATYQPEWAREAKP